jgi:hypothetical protein
MNRKLEQIVGTRDAAMRELNEFRTSKKILADMNFNDAQIEAMENEKIESFDKANAAFWESFKHVIEIKDIEKDEFPKHGATVYVFDDYNYDWQKGDFFDNGAVRYFTFNLYKCDPERYHFWIELPTTFEGTY